MIQTIIFMFAALIPFVIWFLAQRKSDKGIKSDLIAEKERLHEKIKADVMASDIDTLIKSENTRLSDYKD